MDLAELGITQEELLARVTDRIAEQVLHENVAGPEDEEYVRDTPFAEKLEARIKKRVDQAIDETAAAHVLPNVGDYIEKLTLQATNQWGEKTGKALTFREYLVERAEAYLQEKVNWDGHSKAESRDGYSWSGQQTRLTFLVHKHLHHEIETAMKNAVGVVQAALGSALAETVKQKLVEITKSLSVAVKTR